MAEPQKHWKIAQIVEKTEVSKELIHHYLRQGLLPQPHARARYDDQHVRLLTLIKKLREEHTLPLEVIRSIFELFDFEPHRIEPLLLTESLSQRLTRLAAAHDLGLSATLSLEELSESSGVHGEQLAEYVRQKLITPLRKDEQPRFTLYDANVVALFQRGAELGMSLESFRTIASYVRIAFELEHVEFFDLGAEGKRGHDKSLQALFLRREIVSGFVQNVYQSLVQGYLRERYERPRALRAGLDTIVYKPSRQFIEKHRLEERIEALAEEVGREPDRPEHWLATARLYLHAGRSREAAFFLEQSLERWPAKAELRTLYGIALLLSGEALRGTEELEEGDEDAAGAEDAETAALRRLFLALAIFDDTSSMAGRDRSRSWSRVLALVEEALGQPVSGENRSSIQIFGGWLLTALPPALRDSARGLALLDQTLAELEEATQRSRAKGGLAERDLINVSYLLFDALLREGGQEARERLESLRARICRLDPGCDFAREVYLAPLGGDDMDGAS